MMVVIVLMLAMSVRYAVVLAGRVKVIGRSILKSLVLLLSAVLYLLSMYILEMGSTYI